jgi:hypothetical protein
MRFFYRFRANRAPVSGKPSNLDDLALSVIGHHATMPKRRDPRRKLVFANHSHDFDLGF